MKTSKWELQTDFSTFNIENENLKVILSLQFATLKMNIETGFQFFIFNIENENQEWRMTLNFQCSLLKVQIYYVQISL